MGDFNGDGHADLAVASVDDNTVTVLLGRGDGTFSVAPALATVTTPQCVVTADFNGDGVADLTLVNANSILMFAGRGDGTFQAALTTPIAGVQLVTVAAGDFNGDGKPDLVVANAAGGGTLTVLLGRGDGTFGAASVIPSGGSTPIGSGVADFNGDGIPDLAVSDYEGGSNAVSILIGKGDGTFKAPVGMAAPGSELKSIVVGDFNGDGVADLAIGEFWHGLVALFLSKGDGTFADGTAVTANAQLSSDYLAMADFNGDGIPDLAVPSQDGTVPVLLAQPNASATATLASLTLAGPGPHLAEASYPGDPTYNASTSGTTPLPYRWRRPSFSVGSGTYNSVQTVTITDATPGATIYYQANGVSLQTTGYVLYTRPITLSMQGSEIITAQATATGYQESGVQEARFILKLPATTTPVISLAAGVYSAPQTVTISDSAPGAAIYYTTDGSPPSTDSLLYSGPLTITSSETLAVTALAYGDTYSAIASAQYLSVQARLP